MLTNARIKSTTEEAKRWRKKKKRKRNKIATRSNGEINNPMDERKKSQPKIKQD